jgi:nucleoside-diphosphate-sugar epimerase
MTSSTSVVVVTGANGFVGSRVCRALVERGVRVRASVRRPGTAPALQGVAEVVGDFTEREFAATVVSGASAVITTVHPMGSDRATQQRIGVEGTLVVACAAALAGVRRLIHISTAAVYDRSPGSHNVEETSALVGDDAGDYPVTKRDADLALAGVEGMTRVLLRPPAILGPGPTSIWNTLRPAAMREHEQARRTVPEATFAWVHVDDLASLAADLASGRIPDAADPATGPVFDACIPLNVAAERATQRDYYEAVTGALALDPIWEPAPAWTGRILADRAHAWGWTPTVDLARALGEVARGLAPAR